MIYASTITTDAGTAQADAKKTILSVTKGLVYQLGVEFPPGCSGLQHVQVFDSKYQLYPSSIGESFHSDDSLIGFDDLYYKTSEPFEFIIKTWNLDETWDHTIQVRIGFVSSEAFMSRYIPQLQVDQYQRILEEIKATQEAEKALQLESMSVMLEDF